MSRERCSSGSLSFPTEYDPSQTESEHSIFLTFLRNILVLTAGGVLKCYISTTTTAACNAVTLIAFIDSNHECRHLSKWF